MIPANDKPAPSKAFVMANGIDDLFHVLQWDGGKWRRLAIDVTQAEANAVARWYNRKPKAAIV